MTPRILSPIARLLVLAVIALAPLTNQPIAAASNPSGVPMYTVTDLGTLGGSISQAISINDRGQIVGEATRPGDTVFRAFRWQNGVMTDLGTLGGPSSFANALDAAGDVAGGADTSHAYGEPYCFAPADGYACSAFLLRRGVKIDLRALGGVNSEAAGLNDRQQVVGQAETGVIDPTSGYSYAHAYLWQNGAMTDLGTLGDGQYSGANSINADGQVVGVSTISSVVDPIFGSPDFHAARWESGTATDLGTLGGNGSVAFHVNSRGQVAGFSYLAYNVDFHGFLWQHGSLVDLGTVAGDTASQAYFVSDHGQVLGSSGTISGLVHAYLWQDGVMTDLNTRIPSDSGWQLLAAWSMNAPGQIVGVGLIGGLTHAFLLTPSTSDDVVNSTATTASAGSTDNASRPVSAAQLRAVQWRQLRGANSR